MPFRIAVDLLDASYQASTLDRSQAEWPPHPSRIFCALVSVADPDDPVQDAALEWLEQQPLPSVRVPAKSLEAESPRTAWVATNAPAAKPGHAVLPGRTSGGKPKVWPQRTLAHPLVEFEWSTEPSLGVLAVLEVLAKSVPYFGRASGHALVHAGIVDQPLTDIDDDEWEIWQPANESAPARAVRSLRAPYPGYLRRLRVAYEHGESAWQQDRPFPYAPRAAREPDAVEEPAASPFTDLVSFAFPAQFSLDPGLTLSVTSALRQTVMDRLEQMGHDVETMVAVHGHKDADDDRRLCAYLGLPFVGHKHADGRLRGVAVALPGDLEPAHRRALLAVLLRLDGGLSELAVRDVAKPIRLAYVRAGDTELDSLKSVRPERWTRPSRRWTTALPMVLDLFPRRRDIEGAVATGCRLAGLPDPVDIEVLPTGAFLPGAPELAQRALRRKSNERPLPVRHVRLTFDTPVAGPVVLGSKKNFGLGLCLPIDPWEAGA
ncbi:type I-U CRISPR-associated protein Cas5/Cas6 [Streptomyces sp. TRM66268-LWL]|uniref:Type I-U CRISPR-associated protein Cas5/Cas6 n=1 Tax=Streptomyces polyasparticus TaxID=2767826 RepID=A0ABR7SLI0_9ACTN|nr:type I-U CRISPR-associated protein Csb2 [Streptomyces polyasparticus]MBC9715704.1 type I-U CRISPR-associated protein Cas5/Cas6 [Streptomyces polyasparticus]